MKFACPNCKARYSIADEKVPAGASVKFKCKACGTQIRLKRKADPQPKLPDFDDDAASSTRVAALDELHALRQQAAAPHADEKTPNMAPDDAATAVVSTAQLNELRNRSTASDTGAEWHVLLAGKQRGPIDVAEIKSMIARGEIDRRTFVWKSGMGDWRRIADVAELQSLFSAPSASVTTGMESSESTRMMDASALQDAVQKSRPDPEPLFEEHTQMMSQAELEKLNQPATDGFGQSTVAMPRAELDDMLTQSRTNTADFEPFAPAGASPFEEATPAPADPGFTSAPTSTELGSSEFDDSTRVVDAAPKEFHKARTQVANLDEIAAITGFEEAKSESDAARIETQLSMQATNDPFDSLNTPFGGTPAPNGPNAEGFKSLQGSYDHEAPPGEQTRVFMATAGIFKRRRQNLISAVVGTVLFGALASIIALDFLGVYTIPGMGLAYDLTGFEDPNKGRALEREITRTTDPEELARLRAQLQGLSGGGPDKKPARRAKRAAADVEEEVIVDSNELDADKKALAQNLFTDDRKKNANVGLKPPDQIKTQVDLPDGITAEAIQEVIAEKQSSMKMCLAEASRGNEVLRGRMEVQITIAPTGKVTEALVTTAKFKDSAMGGCTVKRAMSWKFPRFNGKPVTVVFPYVLTVGF